MSGTLSPKDSIKFQKLIFRLSRGNVLSSIYDCLITETIIPGHKQNLSSLEIFNNTPKEERSQNSTKRTTARAIFFIAYQKCQGSYLGKKLENAFQAFEAIQFDIPKKKDDIQDKLTEIRQEIEDNFIILEETQSKIDSLSSEIIEIDPAVGISKVALWKKAIQRDKAIWDALNNFEVRDNILYCKFWCPDNLKENMQNSIEKLQDNEKNFNGVKIFNTRTTSAPPTYYKHNTF